MNRIYGMKSVNVKSDQCHGMILIVKVLSNTPARNDMCILKMNASICRLISFSLLVCIVVLIIFKK